MGSWALHLVGTIAMQADCLAVFMSFEIYGSFEGGEINCDKIGINLV